MMTWRPYLRWLAALALPCLLLACSTGGGEKEEEEDGGLIFPGFDTYKPPQDTTNEDSPWVDLDVVSLETPFDLDGVYQDGDLIDVVDDKADVDLTTTKPDGDLEPELDIKEDDEEGPIEYPFQSFGPLTLSMKGPMLNGQYIQLRMAEVSYWKYPAERWEELLDRVEQAGFNGVYLSICWAHHESQQGNIDLATGNRNLTGFMEMIKLRGLYAFVGAGPWIDREAGGCLPTWLAAGAKANGSPVADGQFSLRKADADFQQAYAAWLDQVNAILAGYQVTSFPQGPILFYQIESNYDVFTFFQDANGRIQQDMLGIQPLPLNVGLYMAQLRDTVQTDGINVPLVTSITGDFENGGRRVLGTGDTPGIYPVIDLFTEDEYESMELKLWNLRKEMRKAVLHGQVYMVVPGIAVGVVPSPAHMARLLLAGADVVVVRDFAASSLPLSHQAVSLDREGLDVFSELNEAEVSLGSSRRDLASPVAISGLPRPSFWRFRQLNYYMSLFSGGFLGKDLPYRTGPNKTGSPHSIEISEPALGALEDKYSVPLPGPASGILELMSDHFKDWYVETFLDEPTGRATYYYDTTTGSLMVHLVNLDQVDDEVNAHEREDLLTKLTVNGQKIPRHSNIVVPATDEETGGEGALGWGSKLIILNYSLGIGYPLLEYASSNLAAARQFNGRMLIVAHGQPKVKSGGVYFTEPGEISLANIGGIPQIILNALPEGGIHTDPGGRLAVQFQHDDTGYLVLGLPGGKELVLVATTTAVARNLQFAYKDNGYEMAIMGFDRVDEVIEDETGLTIVGRVSPPSGEFIILTDSKPFKVNANGASAECDWEAQVRALHCTMDPLALPDPTIPLGDFYSRQENYSGSISDLGTSDYPDQFAQVEFAPVSLDDDLVQADSGIAWYAANVDLGAVSPSLEGFLNITGAADIASVFINGTYIGSSSPVGNVPMAATDVAIGLATAGFRVPAGVLVQGNNNVAIRVVALGRTNASLPLFYTAAPLLPPELDSLATLMPHVAVEGLNVNHYKGIWGNVKLTVGALSAPISGPWTISKGDGDRFARPYGMVKGWHAMDPNPSTPGNQGFGYNTAISENTPMGLQDGQMTWVTSTFSSGSKGDLEGGLELALEGRSAMAFVFFNGTFVGTWFSDSEAMSQGLYSKLVQGAGTRQLLADLEAPHFGSSAPNIIPLPNNLLSKAGGQDNRITALFIDLSPALAADLVLPTIGTITGQGQISRFELRWNGDNWYPDATEEEAMVVQGGIEVELLAPPAPEQ